MKRIVNSQKLKKAKIVTLICLTIAIVLLSATPQQHGKKPALHTLRTAADQSI